MDDSLRLDVLLVEKGIAVSRESAKKLIQSGKVTVDGKTETKPSKTVNVSAKIEAEAEKYVSRGGYKLEKALEEFGIDVSGKCFMDCGASTGGFTDCLLQYGAKKVWAVDVGTSQLSAKLQADERVCSIENVNIRYMEKCDWMDGIDAVVMDVSFISAELILQRLFETVNPDAYYIVLVKPQFEAGRENLNKNGIVKDKKVHVAVIEKLVNYVRDNGYTVSKLTYSPIMGGDGNVEYLVYFGRPEDNVYNISHNIIEAVVMNAFDNFKRG